MAFNKNQNESALPVPGSQNRKSEDLLPKFFRTDSNRKFLSSTLDQLITPGVLEKVNAFVGRRTARSFGSTKNENYLPDVTKDREDYQFEPAIVAKDELENVTFYKDYTDYIGQLKGFNAPAKNHSYMNSQEFYVWNPNIDLDKFSNYREYYWLPTGPQPVPVFGQAREIESTYTVKTVVDDDNTAFVFTPNGFTRNPTLKLYRGQKYKFEIDAEGYGLAFAVTRKFLDTDPTTVNDTGENVSPIYKDGVVSDTEFVEKGVIEFTVPDNAPDILYYVSQNDINTSGIIKIFNINENTEIDVENEIVGKKTYKSSNGVVFSNGMKVYFQGTVTPEKYAVGNWYVEGVGDAIKLVPEKDLEVPLEYAKKVDQPFDSVNFDVFPFEDATGFASEKDYIVINRASADRNPWSRYNRWFHISVIEQSALINSQPLELDQNSRATRPIIEFVSGLKLFNHGAKAKETVDLVDTYTTDVFSKIEGSLGYNIDNVELTDGMRVLFAADEDPTVNGRIYEVKFLTHNGKRFISLIETPDSIPNNEDTVLVRNGKEYAGAMFFYRNNKWRRSQIKASVNQHPVFDLFDTNGVSFSDDIVYQSSTFQGNRVFGYKIGSGVNDTELKFPLSYQNISNIGDIVFEFDLLNKEFSYKNNLNDVIVGTDTGFLKRYNYTGESFEYVSGWAKSNEKSKQYVIRQYISEENQEIFPIDVYNNSATLQDLEVKVYVNGKLTKDFVLETTNSTRVVKTNPLQAGDSVVIKSHSATEKNLNGYYEIPLNFERNPLNENIVNFTLGEVNDHVSSVVENHPEFSGTFPGMGNLRDLGNVSVYGRKFLQHSGPVNLALYHITNKNGNAIKAIRKAKYDYAKFKNQFIKLATDSGFDGNVRDFVDEILKEINFDKNSSMPYYSSDMVPYSSGSKTTFVVSDTTAQFYPLEKQFSTENLSSEAVLIYLNSQQLLINEDYVFEGEFVKFLIQLNEDDILDVIYYPNTDGSFVPATPTKLGLYPLFRPELFIDDTYQEPTLVIQGHDGSITVAYNDYRDDLILELEKRIYNNIKVKYDPSILDINDFVGGKYRKTGFSSRELNKVLITDYSQWLTELGQPIVSIKDYWDVNNSFTFNYKNSIDNTGELLSGFWRKIYKDFYDTDRPHTHPWEMLGFSLKPVWWESVYGPAPYTSNNLILWRDLEQGIIREPLKTVTKNKKYERPGLLNVLPVDEHGVLISPYENSLAQQLVVYKTDAEFEFGDNSPVETAWRRSSEYPYALIAAWAVLQPPAIFGLGFDRANTIRDNSGNIVYKPTGKRIKISDFEFPKKGKVLTAGIVNYIADYMSDNTNRYDEYISEIKSISNQLGFKVGGFAEKEKLKLILDSRSPLNKGNVFVPNENYNIFLNKSSVLETVTYSGVIVEKTSEGFVVTGYDKENPVFEFNKPIQLQNDPTIVVGGISESYSEWTPNNEYVIGKVVRFNNDFYRTKITHKSSDSFDTTKFVKIPELPLVGGQRITLRNKFESEPATLLYGNLLPTVQDVVDFLLGYQHRLKTLGFNFETFNQDIQTIEDWTLAAKEFAFWTTQNWDVGSVISLSPSANKLVFSKPFFVVDNIHDPFYNYKILKSDGSPFAEKLLNSIRDNSNQFNLVVRENSNDGIYFAKLPLVQKEHVVIIDNTTVFNDIIYDMTPGYRQERIKVVGYRTDNWNGSLNIPGFVYDQATVKLWKPWTDYAISDIVKHKEFYYSAVVSHSSGENFEEQNWSLLTEKPTTRLLPNWDYRANQLTDFYSLDTDNFDTEQQRLAQHLVGYQKRQYLENIINDDVSQYKFYQGFIREKGSKNSLSKLFDALNTSDNDSVELYEEWAIRLGQYGSVDTFEEVEFILDETKFRLEPQTIELVTSEDTTRTDLIYQIPKSSVYFAPQNYNSNPFPSKYIEKTFTPNSGYVNAEDVNFTVTNYSDLVTLPFADVNVGDYVWVLNEKQSWNVYQVVVKPFDLLNITTDGDFYVLNFDVPVDFIKGQVIGVSGNSESLDSFFTVEDVKLNKVYVLSENDLLSVEFTDSTVSVITTFETRKFSNFQEANISFKNVYHNNIGKIWIDNGKNNKWGVYENTSVSTIFDNLKPLENYSNSGYGESIAVDNNNTIIAVGSPRFKISTNNVGAVSISMRSAESLQSRIVQILQPTSDLGFDTGYGKSVALTPDAKYLIVGLPESSYVKTKYAGNYNPSTVYAIGDQVRYNNTFWEALAEVSGNTPGSSESWKTIKVIEHNSEGTASTYENQGAISIYERDTLTGSFVYKTTIVSVDAHTDELFGSNIKACMDGNLVRILISAPAKFNGISTHQGRVYCIENSGDGWEYKTYIEDLNNTGNNFAINSTGSIVALVSSELIDDEIKREVQIYNLENNTYVYDQTLSSSDLNEKFAYQIAMNSAGTEIAVGAPYNDSKLPDAGKVYIYSKTNSGFALTNTILSPSNDYNEMFGSNVEYSENKLIVVSKNGDLTVDTMFDNSLTTFDNKSTKFVSQYRDIGKIYVYEKIGDSYVYAEMLEHPSNNLTIEYHDLDNLVVNKNHIYVGLPDLETTVTGLVVDYRSNIGSSAWKTVAESENAADLSMIKRIYLYNLETNEILTNLDYIDPRQGKIPGPADQGIDFKTKYDPAVYSYSETNVTVDETSAWTEQYVGKIWWDISNAKWFNPYQGNSQYRVSVWNQLLQDSSIDVYEWVETDLLPSEWDRLADTNEGMNRGISGTSLYGDSAYSFKPVYNQNNTLVYNLYYFWVKNKKTIPMGMNRLSANAIAQFITDPASIGYRFIALTGTDRFTIYNCKSLIEDKNVAIHVSYYTNKYKEGNLHNEYQLLTENLDISKPNSEVERKWIDSLVGYDKNRNQVPDPTLPEKSKYGTLDSPRQGWFVDRLYALRQAIERINSVLLTTNVSDGYDISGLFEKDEIPNSKTGQYDVVVENFSQLRFTDVARVSQAILEPVIVNGKITAVTIVNPGRGYKVAPSFTLTSNTGSGAIIELSIDNLGKVSSVEVIKSGKNYSNNTKLEVRKFSALVTSDETVNGKWSIFDWDPNTESWNRTIIQRYNVADFWNYADWYKDGYNELTKVNHTVDYSYKVPTVDAKIGDIIKVLNQGAGGWALIEKVNNLPSENYYDNFVTVAKQNGTIQLSDLLYNFKNSSTGFDSNIYDTSSYDKEPVVELRKIFEVVKNEIFVGDLEVEWNKLFFASVRYVLSEQKNVDWLFKTSFVRAKHNLGELHQSITFKNDNLESYEDYINEVKPYSTQVREYISAYQKTEPTNTATIDFDNPSYFNTVTGYIENTKEKLVNGEIVNVTEETNKLWLENSSYELVKIEVADSGSGYLSRPEVTVGDDSVKVQVYMNRDKINFIEILPNNKKFYTPPTISINGNLSEDGKHAKLVPILGNGLVRSMKVGMLFDRIKSKPEFSSEFMNEVETFNGSGATTEFMLKYPVDLKINSVEITVNGTEVLRDEYSIENVLNKSAGYSVYYGKVTFFEAPPAGSSIQITYNKNILILDAVDRINLFYKPTANMPGVEDLSQVMQGIDYSGVLIDSYGFGNNQGFGAGGFGLVPWDTYDSEYKDITLILDGSTTVIDLDQPLENGVTYNLYLNRVGTEEFIRLDDENYGTSEPLVNTNAIMKSIVGDGSTTTIEFDPLMITMNPGDVVIIRNIASDGSFAPTEKTLDTVYTGGNIQYTTATGVSASDIIVDGDGLITPATSGGPEELVPGEVFDTLDIQVYTRPSDGCGIINVANYIMKNNIYDYQIPGQPIKKEAIIVKVNNQIIDDTLYTVDYRTNSINVETVYQEDSILTITSVGSNGEDLVEKTRIVFDGVSYTTTLPIKFRTNLTVITSVNGKLLISGTEVFTNDLAGQLSVTISPDVILAGDIVDFMIFENYQESLSQVTIDKTFVADGVTKVHKFNNTTNPVPYRSIPISHKVLVKVGDRILKPGYVKKFIAENNLTYPLDKWQFGTDILVTESDVMVFVNGSQIDETLYNFNITEFSIELINSTVAPIGSEIEIHILVGSEYYFVDTQLTITDTNGDEVDLQSILGSAYTITFTSASNQVYTLSKVNSFGNLLIVESYVDGLYQAASENSLFTMEYGTSSMMVNIIDIKFNHSGILTFKTAPASGTDVEIYQFSNHDINNFERVTYDLIVGDTIDATSADYKTRNLLSSGFINLRVPSYNENYVWVIKNGILLTPNIDYSLVNNRTAIQLVSKVLQNDTIDVLQFSSKPSTQRFGFRVFKDMIGRTHYKRLNQEKMFKLEAPLNYYDKFINLVSTQGITLPNPSENVPGVVFINGERIEYFVIQGNRLTQLRRGTMGTGVKNVYPAGTSVLDQGISETINYRDITLTYSTTVSNTNQFNILQHIKTNYELENNINLTVNSFDVYLGGVKLRKTSLFKHDPNLSQISPTGDVQFEPEFSVNGNTLIINGEPTNGLKLELRRKVGQVWNEIGKSLADSNNEITRFILNSTIALPE